VRLIAGVSAFALLATLAGCGGSSSNGAQSAISDMHSALTSYNQSAPGNVSDTVAACRSALDRLSGDRYLAHPSAPAKDRPLAAALQHAYQAAATGFTDCAASSPFNYARMARADAEIAAANSFLQRARALDR
jgi:hypothetical protein